MNRRGFLGLLAAGAAGFVLDPERLLWRPGEKSYHFISRPFDGFAMGDVLTFDGRIWRLANTPDVAKGHLIGVFDGIKVIDHDVVVAKTDEFYSGMVYGRESLWLQHQPTQWAMADNPWNQKLKAINIDRTRAKARMHSWRRRAEPWRLEESA